MKKDSSRRSNLLLMEIILSVLFFSFASAVCLQMFVRASLLGRETRELHMAVRYVSSAAELFSRPEHAMGHLQELYPQARIDGEEALIWFDEDYSPCAREEAAYCMEISTSSQDEHTTFWSVTLYGGEQEQEIYQLEGSAYRQLTLPDRQQEGR